MMIRIEIPEEVKRRAGQNGITLEKQIGLDLRNYYVPSADDVAYWYFRLNGFLATSNFIIHPPRGGSQRTDADVFGIRFSSRSEPGLDDDSRFKSLQKPLLVIAEVTTSQCKINGPWTNREEKNIEYLLESIGLFPSAQISEIATQLYDKYSYDHDFATVQMFAIGRSKRDDWIQSKPLLTQLTFLEIATFIYRRFRQRRDQKKNHKQWDQTGQILWDLFESNLEKGFVEKLQQLVGIPISHQPKVEM